MLANGFGWHWLGNGRLVCFGEDGEAGTFLSFRFWRLAGVHAFRQDIRMLSPYAQLSIPTDVLTLPKLFKKAGYQTAVIGKWQLGFGDGKTKVNWNGDVKPFEVSCMNPNRV